MKKTICLLLITISLNCFSQTALDSSFKLKKDTVEKQVLIRQKADTTKVLLIIYSEGVLKYLNGIIVKHYNYREDTGAPTENLKTEAYGIVYVPDGKDKKGKIKYKEALILADQNDIYDIRPIVKKK